MDNLVWVNRESKKVITTSLKVAEVFEKEHKHVIEAIKNLECSLEFGRSNFRLTSYKDYWNRQKPMYEITRDGFTFLAMGFTGKKAAQFKEDYIKAFNFMEEILRQTSLQEQNQIVREMSKLIRRELTDVLKDSGLNEKMHGFGYKTFTDLIYKLILGMTAKKYRETFGLPKNANVREHLNEYQQKEVARLEKAIQGMIDIGMEYSQIKQTLINNFLKKELSLPS